MSKVPYQDGRSTKSIIPSSGLSFLKITIEEAISSTHLCYWGSNTRFISSTTLVVLAKQLFHQGAFLKVVFPPKQFLHQSSCFIKQTFSLLGQKYEVITSI